MAWQGSRSGLRRKLHVSVEHSGTSARPGGLTPILVATVVAGAAGYLTQVLAQKSLSPSDFVEFSVFWATLYLVVAAVSGIQQEVSRATTRITNTEQRGARTARVFALAVVAIVVVAVPATALLWGHAVFPTHTWLAVAALALGTGSYVVIATLSGVFYGLNEWAVIGAQTVIDAVLRVLAVGVAVWAGAGADILIWAVVVPFPLTVAIMWPFVRKRVVGRYTLDVSLRGLTRNASLTVGGAVATGLLVSGFPLALQITSRADSATAMGILLGAITLTRAPLIIPLMALQSFLTVYFGASLDRVGRLAAMILGGVACATVLASVLAYFVGPPIMVWLNPEYVIDPAVVAAIVASAGITGGLCVSGPASLARGRHGAFLAGWVVAALGMVGVLMLPIGLAPRAIGALSIGPLAGLIVHLIALRGTRITAVPERIDR